MSKFKDLINFEVEGSKVCLSKEDSSLVSKLIQKRNKLNTFDGDIPYIKTFNNFMQCKIFNELKLRQGEKTRLTFINSRGYPVEVLNAYSYKNKVILNCVFCRARKSFNMYLDTFISDAIKIKPEAFADNYLVPVKLKLDQIESELKVIENKYNKIYKEELKEKKQAALAETSIFKQLPKQARKYDIKDGDALNLAKKDKGVQTIKNYWNTVLSTNEKEHLINWVAKNIYSIRVYGVIDGKSGNILNKEYADCGNIKLRPVEKNEKGEITSQDSIGAYVYFKSIENAPLETIKKIVSTGRKFTLGGGTVPKRLADKNFALFLLSEYHDRGFKAGVRNLNKQIIL